MSLVETKRNVRYYIPGSQLTSVKLSNNDEDEEAINVLLASLSFLI